jgi:hypothetical protein
MQNKVLNEVAIEQMDDLIKAVKDGGGNIVLYRHNISIQLKSGVENKGYIYINYISSENTIVETLMDLKTLIKEFANNFVNVPCSGYYNATSATASPVIGLYNEDGAISLIYNDGAGTGGAVIMSSSVIVDTVTTI